MLTIPDSLLKHPELKRRGIVLRHVLKIGSVYEDDHTGSTPPKNVVKLIKEDSQAELDIYDYLLADINNPRNHTLPCEVVRGDVPILIMPYARISSFELWNYSDIYNCMYQILEGLEYMHDRRVAHMDIFHENIIMVSRRKVWQSPRLVPSRVYFIDFGCSLRLPFGPGIQPAVKLQDTVFERPREGATHFDPYSWDMLRVGDTFDAYLDMLKRYYPRPWLASLFTRWVVGKEREDCKGTVGVCRCRPSARVARRVFRVLWWAFLTEHALVRAFLWVKARCFPSPKRP